MELCFGLSGIRSLGSKYLCNRIFFFHQGNGFTRLKIASHCPKISSLVSEVSFSLPASPKIFPSHPGVCFVCLESSAFWSRLHVFAPCRFLATPCGAPTATAFLFASVCLHSGCCFGNAFRLLNIFSDA